MVRLLTLAGLRKGGADQRGLYATDLRGGAFSFAGATARGDL